MELSQLTAISPVDGRYRAKTEELAGCFSEYSLIKYRLYVEIEYFIKLCGIPLPQLRGVKKSSLSKLRKIHTAFSISDALKIKAIEARINHDVKAVEYFLKEKFRRAGLEKYSEFVHFGLTSQDITNTAIPLAMRDALTKVLYPMLGKIVDELELKAKQWKNAPMLARTHGQPASPTMMGKELMVFVERVKEQLGHLKAIPFSAKFGGATGNFNAHKAAYPAINWVRFADDFINRDLGLKRSKYTTQIEHYDNLAAQFDALKRINTVFIDLCQDFWSYISRDYLRQKVVKSEVGSSAMPHKINPIDFENAEGNFGLANGIFTFMSMKLPVSRLQRDLTDSTVTRNIGVPLAHMIIALKSLDKGLSKISLNKDELSKDLGQNWAVVAEGIQTILRREGYPQPYETLKKLTRNGQMVTAGVIHEFIENLDVSRKVKDELKRISPSNYTGFTF